MAMKYRCEGAAVEFNTLAEAIQHELDARIAERQFPDGIHLPPVVGRVAIVVVNDIEIDVLYRAVTPGAVRWELSRLAICTHYARWCLRTWRERGSTKNPDRGAETWEAVHAANANKQLTLDQLELLLQLND